MPRGLTLVVLSDEHARVHGGLTLAATAAAMGRSVQVFFQGEAVRAVLADRCWAKDPSLREHGIATVRQLLDQCSELGVRLVACETGIHQTGARQRGLYAAVETGGLVGALTEDAELVTI
ncbi:hypothetical protein B5C34_04745 [Pacificimonas flava]|uniref:Uncharacterized protein n=2 Tax=Pacificimonas TaxID=1960290 RepID=A0A219B3A8_9SPHN|nr:MULTISPECIES: DsrE family protein [Pacificimonas]MBZ6377474.1 DsrE family protein [Pacificimonas aurantium]OWV32827.1 hypothetical protein B5C34_04745 [Pacificimonas flava]